MLGYVYFNISCGIPRLGHLFGDLTQTVLGSTLRSSYFGTLPFGHLARKPSALQPKYDMYTN